MSILTGTAESQVSCRSHAQWPPRAPVEAHGLAVRPLTEIAVVVAKPQPQPSDERQEIERALAASRARVYGADGAAETLGVPPSTLEARIRRLGIDKDAFRRRASRP
jgi:transcriptional regulator with GAF, ATPase, and Fis domain